MSESLSHLGKDGAPRMVDVSAKEPTVRRAVAAARVTCDEATARLLLEGRGPKGDVGLTARIAGIQAAKRTSELIPLCHPISLSDADVDVVVDPSGFVDVRAEVVAVDRTGVEMEALTAAAVAALTVYDMIKSRARGATIADVRLLEKSGGRSGTWRRDDDRAEGDR